MLDAVVPRDGESLFGILAAAEGVTTEQRLAQSSDRWLMPATQHDASFFGITDPADVNWVNRHLTDDSALVLAQPAKVTDGFARVGRRTYVRASRFHVAGLDRVYERLAADPTWTTHRWDVGHDVMVDHPDRVARLVAEA
jgi:hypothetical protein